METNVVIYAVAELCVYGLLLLTILSNNTYYSKGLACIARTAVAKGWKRGSIVGVGAICGAVYGVLFIAIGMWTVHTFLEFIGIPMPKF